MNESKYTYSILHYKHSAVLGESLNVGVFVYFEQSNSLYFKHAERLTRIKSVYDQISEKSIRQYLKLINSNVTQLAQRLDPFFLSELNGSFDYFISSYILQKDSSALQFSKARTHFQYEKTDEEIIDYLVSTFLLENKEVQVNKEHQLGLKFYEPIQQQLESLVDPGLFQKNYKLTNEAGLAFRFDYAWQNENWHLVKPLNFDLTDAKKISDKAHRTLGLIIDLQQTALTTSLQFDFLVGKPTQKKLFKEYDHSLHLLERFEKATVIEEERIESYAHNAIAAILSHTPD
ncbi:DUF3037 domain-containing protein [Leeuwenhoekiella sp. H156]|uniref:DUF3037 domain-containing protein n=1 Tax=Leeuwenhoekiella sp. H156 TaxID=3450128 RepID=UPI003FA4CE1E